MKALLLLTSREFVSFVLLMSYEHTHHMAFVLLLPRWLFSMVNSDPKYLSVPFPLPGQIKARSIESYEEHNRRAREILHSDRLLEYNVATGYKPLCKFLNISDSACPKQPFPKSNSARSVRVQAISSIIIPVTVVCMVLFSLFAFLFHRLTGKKVIPWLSSKRQPFLKYLSKSEKGKEK